MHSAFTIGAASRATGTKVTTIRFYESIGLVSPPARTASGRRIYQVGHVRRLAFIRNGRRLGFSIDELRSLIALDESPEGDCAEASKIAQRHLDEVEKRLSELSALREELARIATSCQGARTPDCRIIQAIANEERA